MTPEINLSSELTCDKCHRKLETGGALIFGVPTKRDHDPQWVTKRHLCGECFDDLLLWMGAYHGIVTATWEGHTERMVSHHRTLSHQEVNDRMNEMGGTGWELVEHRRWDDVTVDLAWKRPTPQSDSLTLRTGPGETE